MATHGVRPTCPTWGTHWEDYRAREKAKLKRSNSAQPNRTNKRKKASGRALQVPNLADTLDEYNKFTQLLIDDESDTESEVDPDTNESFMSMEDLGQTLDPCLMEGLFRYIKEEAGPPPDIESCMCLEHRIATQMIVVVLTYPFQSAYFVSRRHPAPR